MRRRSPIAAIAVATTLAVGCGAQRGADAPHCAPPIGVPSGFEVTQSLEDPHPDRTATRRGLRDDRGRTLNLFSGVEAEFGEGLPLVDEIAVSDGTIARLLGAERIWLLAWRDGGGPCASKAVFSSGFRRRAFLALLREEGLVR